MNSPVVHGHHDDSWYPEGNGRADQGIVDIDDEDANIGVILPELLMIRRRVPTQHDRGKRDDPW